MHHYQHRPWRHVRALLCSTVCAVSRARGFVAPATQLTQLTSSTLPARANATMVMPPASPPELRLLEIAALEYQEGVEAWQFQNLLGAINLFLRSAQKGHEVGEYCFRWGQYHELPPPDVNQALKWYKRGARMKHKNCLTSLGKLHVAMGHHAQARTTLSEMGEPRSFGGEYGDSLAQWFLAELNLKDGRLREAVRWWKRSAENGDVDAMMRLVQVFSEGGAGVPKEEMRARHWLFAAAAHGHQEALSKVSWLADEDRPPVEQRWMDDMRDRGWV